MGHQRALCDLAGFLLEVGRGDEEALTLTLTLTLPLA